jgi:hypothetical protein
MAIRCVLSRRPEVPEPWQMHDRGASSLHQDAVFGVVIEGIIATELTSSHSPWSLLRGRVFNPQQRHFAVSVLRSRRF